MRNLKLFFIPILILSVCLFSSKIFAKPIKATVMNVNKKHNFIVLNKGREEGLTNGMKLKLFKDNEYIGTIEVIKAKKGVAAIDTRSLEDITISTKDELILRYGESDRDIEASFKPHKEAKRTKLPPVPAGEVKREESKAQQKVSKKEKKQPKEETPLVLKPFKKVKDWGVSAGREVKSWFTKEKGFEKTGRISSDKEIGEIKESQISSVSAVKFVKLETDIEGSRRSVLFLINEELKNRGFVVTNYSLIEGIINAQKPMKLSTFREIFVDMSSAIDHKIIYTINVKKIDPNNTKITLDISATYKEGGEYKRIKVNRDSKIVNEAKDILREVKSKIS